MLGVFPRVLIATAFASANGSTDDPSCGGTDMDVYLRGDELCHLDWSVEMSNKWVREEYFFLGARPVLVIETVEKKHDSHGEPLPKPQLVSRTRHDLLKGPQSADTKKFLEHAEFLLRDFASTVPHLLRVFAHTLLTRRCSEPLAVVLRKLRVER